MDLERKVFSFSKDRTDLALVLVFKTRQEALEDLGKVRSMDHDLIELRMDYRGEEADDGQILDDLKLIRTNYSGPILFTLRSLAEGGYFDGDDEEYYRINSLVLDSGWIDLIDLELGRKDETLKKLVDQASSRGVLTIASSHDFKRTDSGQEMRKKLLRAKKLGFQVGKLAQWARTREDVFRMMEEPYILGEELDIFTISISMGELGSLTRLAGRLTGSVLTFAPIDEPSAPGQIGAEIISGFLKR